MISRSIARSHARQAKEQFTGKLAAYERTFEALHSSMRLLLNVEDEQALFDMATDVTNVAGQQALYRLINLYKDGSAPLTPL